MSEPFRFGGLKLVGACQKLSPLAIDRVTISGDWGAQLTFVLRGPRGALSSAVAVATEN